MYGQILPLHQKANTIMSITDKYIYCYIDAGTLYLQVLCVLFEENIITPLFRLNLCDDWVGLRFLLATWCLSTLLLSLLCIQKCTTSWMPWRKYCLKVCTLSQFFWFITFAAFKKATCKCIQEEFRTDWNPIAVAILNSYKHLTVDMVKLHLIQTSSLGF